MSRILLAAIAVCALLSGSPETRASERPDAPRTAPVDAAGPTAGLRLELSAPLARSELIQAVLDRNPGIASARLAWQAALARVPQAESLEDPMASYSFAPLSIGASDTRFGQVLRLTQKIPFPGTLRLRAEIAEAESAAAGRKVEEVQLHLATMASGLYDDLWLIDRGLEITAQHVELLTAYQSVAASRYATGAAPQQAPIQAEVEGAHLLHRQTVLRTERRVAVARINALLHRQATEALPAPPVQMEVDEDLFDTTAGAVAALENRPEVAAQEAQIGARRAAVALEKLNLRPDFEPMASYNSMWRAPEHRWSVGLNVSIPLWRKGLKASVAEAQVLLEEGELVLSQLEIAIQAEVEIALAALEEAHHVVRLYRNRVLPAARDQISAARSAFETGGTSMLDLIDAERSLRTAELNHLQAVAASYSARADLDQALGRIPFATSPPSTPAERNP